MEYKHQDIDDALTRAFYEEWDVMPDGCGMDEFVPWEEFINTKDLGIECIRDEAWVFRYVVTDAQRWMINKIRYGL